MGHRRRGFGDGLAGWALRDLIAPVRLAADADGVTVVTGFARRRRHLPWAQIERVRVDRRDRLGLRSEMLEIDAGDAPLPVQHARPGRGAP